MMTEQESQDNFLKDMAPISNAPVAPAHGIAAIALNFALKYHNINTVQDGTLYQQYKLEGRNMRELHLDMVFETAIQMEAHLLASSQRIAALVVDAITMKVDESEEGDGAHDAEAPEGREGEKL